MDLNHIYQFPLQKKRPRYFFNYISLLILYQVDKMVLYSISEMRHDVNEQTGKFEPSFSKILVIFAQIRLFVFEVLLGFLDLNLPRRKLKSWLDGFVQIAGCSAHCLPDIIFFFFLSLHEYAVSGIIQLPLFGIRLLLRRDLIGQPRWTNYSSC